MKRLFVAGLVWMLFAKLSSVMGAGAPPPGNTTALDASLHKLLADAGLPNPLREDRQRPVDPRLIKIETEGIERSGLFTGQVRRVSNAKAFRALSERVQPGDQVVLTGSDWKDTHQIKFAAHGTAQAPILIRAEKPDSVVFSGSANVAFYGEHLIIMDLVFKDIVVAATGSTIFRLGNGKEHPAAHCIVNRIRIENCGSLAPADWPRIRMWYMTVHGPGNTVANSTFAQLKNYGQMLAAQDLPQEGLLQLHVLNNRFIDRPMVDRQNGYELIQIGWSGEHGRPAGALIQGNHIEAFNVDNEEIFTLKASDIFVRSNNFVACQGSLNLRTADRVLLQGNTFDGQGRPNTGGIRIEGADHVVIENTFRNLKAPRDYYSWTLSLMAADVEATGATPDGYGRARHILIANNRFEHNDARIAIGTYPRPTHQLLPHNILIQNNTFVGAATNSPLDYLAPDPTGALPKEVHLSGNRFLP